MKEREVNALPSPGWLSWAKIKVTEVGGRKVTDWDSGRVFKRFIEEEDALGLKDEWDE